MTWATVREEHEDVLTALHVVPWDDVRDRIANGHQIDGSCPCQPEALRDAPLDTPILSHRDPAFPGADRGFLA